MTVIASSVNNVLLTPQPPKKVTQPQASAPRTANVAAQVPLSNAAVNANPQPTARTFNPESLISESSNRALGEYLAIKNSEKREQLSQLLGLDVYA